MSFKTSAIKWAIKWTPKSLILWVANKKLKGIARLTDFSFNIESRRAYVQTILFGETEPIEVLVENFAVVNDHGSYQLIVQQAQSNRPWLNNILSRIVGKPWKIPEIPQLAPHVELVSQLLKPQSP